MRRYLRWHWHRFLAWIHLRVATHRFDQGDWHFARFEHHHHAATRILWPPPPRGPPDEVHPAESDRAPPTT